MDPLNISAKFEVRSFTHSWDNRGYSKNLWSPWICPRSLFSQIFKGLLFGWTLWIYLPSLKFVASSRSWDNSDWSIAAFVLRHITFPHPLLFRKFSHVPLEVGWWPLGCEERRCCAKVFQTVRAISFQYFQPTWSWSTNVTDRQTDRQTTCNLNTALCTIVHRAVKTHFIKQAFSSPSGSHKFFGFGLWLTLRTVDDFLPFLLTYLLTYFSRAACWHHWSLLSSILICSTGNYFILLRWCTHPFPYIPAYNSRAIAGRTARCRCTFRYTHRVLHWAQSLEIPVEKYCRYYPYRRNFKLK